MEAKYAKDLERLARDFSEKSQKEALGWVLQSYLKMIHSMNVVIAQSRGKYA